MLHYNIIINHKAIWNCRRRRHIASALNPYATLPDAKGAHVPPLDAPQGDKNVDDKEWDFVKHSVLGINLREFMQVLPSIKSCPSAGELNSAWGRRTLSETAKNTL